MRKGNLDKVILASPPAKNDNIVLEYNTLRKAVLTVRALDHEMRKQIIKMLTEKETMTVTEVYNALNIEQSVASQHLAVLRRAGVVKTGRIGKFIHYSLNQEKITEIQQLVNQLAS